MKKIMTLTIFLAVVSAVAGGLLSYFNTLTAPVIAYNQKVAETESLREMYPDADANDFEEVESDSYTVDYPFIQEMFVYGDNIIFNNKVTGYDGGTTFLVSINKESLVVDGFQVISNEDTKGIGSRIMDDSYKEQVVGKEADGPIDTISGATYTSTPVVEAIHECADIVANMD